MNREVHVRIWERPEVQVLRATRHERQFAPPKVSDRFAFSEETFAGRCGNEKDAPRAAIGRDANDQRSATRRGQSPG